MSMCPVAILLVDDSRAIRSLLRRELSAIYGDGGRARFYEAGTGAEALKMVSEFDIDLVMLDINISEMDGIEALNQMQKRGLRAPVIIVTSDSARAQVERAVEAGARGYVVKPFSKQGLTKSIERAIARDISVRPNSKAAPTPPPAPPEAPAASETVEI